MGEILGLGLSHYPGFIQLDSEMAIRIKLGLEGDRLPATLKDPRNWPDGMREEWSDDEGLAFAAKHRADFVAGVRHLRTALDEFNPDLVLVFGDDQYEEFRTIVPPFCVFLTDEVENRPFLQARGMGPKPTIWGEAPDTVFRTRGIPEAGTFLVEHLLGRGLDVAYCSNPQFPQGLAHAFIRTVLYLDYDRQEWTYPLLPFHVNAYGKGLSSYLNGRAAPSSPTPARCFDVGRAVGRAMTESPWPVALVASSSWSHGTLTRKHHRFYPDIEADRRRYHELTTGTFAAWRNLSLEEIEDSGQNELRNWILLAGPLVIDPGPRPRECRTRSRSPEVVVHRRPGREHADGRRTWR